MPGFPVHHQLLELTQVHVHRVSDAIQPSHPLSSPSPPALNLSRHQGLLVPFWFFASGGQSIGASASASVLPVNIQGWFPLGSTGWISLQSKGLSKLTKSKMKLMTVEESWDLRVGKDLNTHHIQLPTQGGTLFKDVPSGSPLNFRALQDSYEGPPTSQLCYWWVTTLKQSLLTLRLNLSFGSACVLVLICCLEPYGICL